MIPGKFGGLKTLNITPFYVEPTIASTAPPTAMSTGSPQMSVTYNASTMKPLFSGNAMPVSFKPALGLNISGQNTSGAAVTLYFQINKNGTSYKTGNTSVPNNYYYTLSLIDGGPNTNYVLNDGDVYDVYLWSSATSGMNFFYENYYVVVSRIDTGAKYLSNYTVSINSLSGSGLVTTGHAGASWTGTVYFQPDNDTVISNGKAYTSTGKPIVFPLFTPHPIVKLYQLQGGDATTGCAIGYHSANYPNMQQTYYPTQIQYREIFLR